MLKIKKLWQDLLKNQGASKKKFTILLPPPNITGSLHVGHFFNWSIQDLIVRKAYIDGFYANWIVGIDHAGISAQYVVERELKKENIRRIDLGREKFEQKIWEWKEHSESQIRNQAENFGFFFDWDNRIFTLDIDYQQQVIDAFVRLYKDGLISKSKRITNWDPQFKTALSDLEVIEKIEKSKMYVIRYECVEDSDLFINIATTRPETIFADSAIAVNPGDDRYQHFKGKNFRIPLIKREIPLIFDDACQMDKGTGALKITPAHAIADYEISLRHNIETIEIIGKEGLLFNVLDDFVGLNTKDARKKIVEVLKDSGDLIDELDWEGVVYYAEKSNNPIETILTEQWFLDVSKMAKAALENEEIEFIPGHIREIFEHWMNNIKPWCISRQLWWGHQIPIWYKEDKSVICAHSQEEAVKIANGMPIERECDVLDTWFSSALWPIGTQKEFTITDILVTGSDILFFWVARMIMFSLYFKGEIPFSRVFFNGIVRDENRQKMSKTKQNVLDPLDLSKQYGVDGLRFALLKNAIWSKDVSLQKTDLELGQFLVTKFKNAHRFLVNFMKAEENPSQIMNNWIEGKILDAKNKIDKAIKDCAFHQATNIFYHLFWDDFCAWYIEGLKLFPCKKALEYWKALLKIAHPILPFTSEECFQHFVDYESSIMNFDCSFLEEKDTKEFEDVILASKILRKLSFFSNLKNFNLKNANHDQSELIRLYTNLSIIDMESSFRLNAGCIEIFIDRENAALITKGINEEISQVSKKIEFEEKRIKEAYKVPEVKIEEWMATLKSLKNQYSILLEWLKNIS
jgi:valyl-tRNA synthetase